MKRMKISLIDFVSINDFLTRRNLLPDHNIGNFFLQDFGAGQGQNSRVRHTPETSAGERLIL